MLCKNQIEISVAVLINGKISIYVLLTCKVSVIHFVFWLLDLYRTSDLKFASEEKDEGFSPGIDTILMPIS